MKGLVVLFVAILCACFAVPEVESKGKCDPLNCVEPYKCSQLVKLDDLSCETEGTSCCYLLDPEYKTKCHQFGGICVDKCPKSLQAEKADDCGNEICCILI